MTEIDVKVLVEPLAHVLCAQRDGHCLCADGYGLDRIRCDEAEQAARAAIAYLLPLIIERCAEVAGKEATDFKLWKNLEASYGCSVVSDAIRALIQKEASDGEV